MSFLFEKLAAYQKAIGFASKIDAICDDLPRGKYFLADQFRRASLSISLNIAEGNGRWHKADRRQFFIIARGSAYECIPILEVLHTGNLIDSETYKRLREDIEEVCRMIAGLVKGLENRE